MGADAGRRPRDAGRSSARRTGSAAACRPHQSGLGARRADRGRWLFARWRVRVARPRAGHRGPRLFDRARRARGSHAWTFTMTVASVRRAGWLPGLRECDIEAWQTLTFGELQIQIARLSPDGLAAQLERIARARDEYLAQLGVRRIASLLDRVASRWLDPASPFRREAESLLSV